MNRNSVQDHKNIKRPKIYFYFPCDQSLFENLPTSPEDFWKWLSVQESISPMQGGGCIWTLQTYLYLKTSGYSCELVNEIPQEGVILSHRDFLIDSFRPDLKLLLICLRADVDRHPYSQLHIVQNPYQEILKSPVNFWESHFIPHWPQPSIIQRDPKRGNTFKNVAFIGNEGNLVTEFKDEYWYSQLEKLELHFQRKLNHSEWHNYSDIDVIVAVRSLGSTNDWKGKPASKLYNAWYAGVPAILGYESAFRAERKNKLDYLEATSLEEVIDSLKLLKDNEALRQAIIENGKLRAQEIDLHNMVLKWQTFINDIAIPAYESWCYIPRWQQLLFFKIRDIFIMSRPGYYSLKSFISKFLNT